MRPSYGELYERVLNHGVFTPSRMGGTRELLSTSVLFAPGEMVSRKGINDALGFMELVQILGGVFDLQEIKRVAPRANHALFTEQMAYGPRIAPQMPSVLRKLEEDPTTRQAVVFIGGKEDGPSDNLPCTTSVQFLIRDEALYTVTTMRSWDLTRGLAYDIMFQGGLAMAVARCLGIGLGTCVCQAGSLHLYYDQSEKWPTERSRHFEYEPWLPNTWKGMSTWARDQVGRFVKVPAGITVVEG